MKTYQAELIVVGSILASVCYFTKGEFVEYVGSLAVFVSFCHAQVSNRLAEAESTRTDVKVDCYSKSAYYFMLKELLWFIYFVLHQSWSALVGVIVFLLYPAWRLYWRSIHPLK